MFAVMKKKQLIMFHSNIFGRHRRTVGIWAVAMAFPFCFEVFALGVRNHVLESRDSAGVACFVSQPQKLGQLSLEIAAGFNKSKIAGEGMDEVFCGYSPGVNLGYLSQVKELFVSHSDSAKVSEPSASNRTKNCGNDLVGDERQSILPWLAAFVFGLIGGSEVIMWLLRRVKKSNVANNRPAEGRSG